MRVLAWNVERCVKTRSTVNHICASDELVSRVTYVGAWEGTVNGERLSDHNGIYVDFE